MAAKQYQWKTSFDYQNSLEPNYHLSHGVSPATYDNWQTADIGTPGSNSSTYYYRDSNTMYSGGWYDIISSQVDFSVTQTWTTSVDNRNNLTVSITTTVNSVDRVDARGGDQNTPGRNIYVYKEQGGAAYISITDVQVATNHNLSGPVDLGTYTFTLAPGESATMSTLYIHNQTVGSASYDDIWAGVQFMNPLPKEAIPHAVLGSNSTTWLSHNRSGGDLRLWNGSRWTDNLRNTDWGTGYGDPPSVMKENKWLNARVIGFEG